MDRTRLRFWTLYLTRFAGGFGFITLVTLLPKYINELDPGAVAVPELALGGLALGGFSLSRGFVIGMFTTGFTLAQTVAVVPLSWAGDRYDKRLVLAGTVGLGAVVYAAFPLVNSSLSFILARAAQGVAVTGAGLMSLALVGELAREGTRANHIGKANAARFAASILGSVSAGILYDLFGFTPIFIVITILLTIAVVAIWVFLPPDETRIRGFPFTDLALNERILTMATFRVQYAVAVTLVRTWVPIYAGVSAASGGLAYGGIAVAATVVAEKFTNMLCQPHTGRISDGYGRARFVFVGGGLYGLIALAVPFSPMVGEALALPAVFPVLGPLSPAFLPLVGLAGLLGVADSLREPASMALFADEGSGGAGVASSFGIRELLWRPGSVVAPLLGGYLMAEVGMEWVFFVGGASAITGVLAFLAALTWSHGTDALTAW
ncbi:MULTISPECIES: MFS transporter [unclassified Haloferax]|uniref:MFS transporter n=1 Tax=unclassified Haloferax TaxID=2625095 RepID=UPI0002B22628|nr:MULTISPECIES: MFS transporter [unclassified Haloferax]ELZ60693.1 multidrug resistance protein-like protein [Haloferax sp. ATCC BAA-646]ELZ65471.1 multidrug resistance protein-like protein [Haloferax sp. ATCC BAA-645]ELZ69059.1 multidrug resistance protein-like protein [Haloferax sp. ATCC BAA-644]